MSKQGLCQLRQAPKQKPEKHCKYGKTKAGRQRYKCNSCGSTFTETKGTIFYRRRTPADEIIETLALLAEGSRISSLTRGKGHKEDTILDWLREAGEHAEAIYFLGRRHTKRFPIRCKHLLVAEEEALTVLQMPSRGWELGPEKGPEISGFTP